MGLTLNRPAEGSVAWFSSVDSNWSKLQDEFVARRKSDGTPVTVTGTTSETALMANCTIPANTLSSGVVLWHYASGVITIPASTTPTVTWRMRWGGLAGTLLVSWAWTFPSSGSAEDYAWVCQYPMICQTAGASGTVHSDGFMALGVNAIGCSSGLPAIDTTAEKVLLWTVQSTVTGVSTTQRIQIVNQG